MSGLGIRNAWRPLDRATVATLPAILGVFEIADAQNEVLHIGYAGGRSLFGARSVIGEWVERGGTQFRVEFTMQYISRWKELLMDHVTRHGRLPPRNDAEDGFVLGQLGQRVKKERR